MNPPLSIAPDPFCADLNHLLAGLSSVDANRIQAAVSAARSTSTRKTYALAWSQWERWCIGRGLSAVPANPYALAALLTERAEAGRAMATLDMACTVIRHVHRAACAEDPVGTDVVDQVRRGLRRTYGVTPRRQARPLPVDELRQIIGTIDRSTVIGIRDAAMILLGYASALRRSELVALTLADITYKPTGLLLAIRQSKMDQEARCPRRGGARREVRHRPSRSARAWRALRGEHPGTLFTRLWGSQISDQPFAGRAALRVLRGRAEAAGIDATRLTAHSLRVGHATTAAPAGVSVDRIAAQTRHKGRAYYRRKLAAGKTKLEALRCLKRRISDAFYRQLLADAERASNAAASDVVGTGPGGHCGASQESSAVDLPPRIDTSDQPLPGPANLTLQPLQPPRKTTRPKTSQTTGQHRGAGLTHLRGG